MQKDLKRINNKFFTINKLNISTKVLIISLLILIFMTICSLFIKPISIILFYLFGVWCIYFLVWLIYNVYLISKVNVSKKELFIIGLGCLLIVGIYTYIVINRVKLYYWDNMNYYVAQLKLYKLYDNSFISGIKWIIGSTIKDNYGRFLLCFTSLLLKFTNGTHDAFVICTAIAFVIPTFIIFSLCCKKIIKLSKVKNDKFLLYISMLLLLSFPLLHHISTLGQPDIVGLIFCGIIILLTIDYNFQKIDWYRYFLLIISIICLLISRRWYMYWLLGYAISYGVYILISTIKIKNVELKKETFRNILKFCIVCLLSVGLLLMPMFIRILKQDFSSYTSWNLGGYSYEIVNQFKRLGLLYVIIMGLGIIYGLFNKNLRKINLIFIFTFLIAFFTFVKTQNMGTHQSLILVPSYIIFFICAIIGVGNIKNKYLKNINMLIIIFVLLSTWYGTIFGNKYLNNNLFYTSLSIKPTKRNDYEKVGKMVQFIKNNTTENDIVYINSATADYCSDTFSGYIHPDLYLTNIIPHESSIDAASGFPINYVAEAKYIFTTNILMESTGATKGHIVSSINEALNNKTIVNTKFKLIDKFEMSDKLTFYAYERIKAFDKEEANYWKKLLEEPNEKYPDLFNKRIDDYLYSIENKES